MGQRLRDRDRSEGLAPARPRNAVIDQLTARLHRNWNARAEMLQNSQFVDAKVELFAKYASAAVGAHRRTARSSGGSSRDETAASLMTETRATSLERRLGPLDAAAIVVSNVIGGGILFTPASSSAQRCPIPGCFCSTWLAGGALAFAGAMAYAELAALRPRAGGEYVYLREAFGRSPAFSRAGRRSSPAFSGAIAASAVVLASYLGRFVPAPAMPRRSSRFRFPYVPLVVSRQTLVAHRGDRADGVDAPARASVRAASSATARGAEGLGAAASSSRSDSSLGAGIGANLRQAAGAVAPPAWLLALIPVMFTYSGWNAAAYVAEEIRDPGRNVPLALGLGTVAVDRRSTCC